MRPNSRMPEEQPIVHDIWSGLEKLLHAETVRTHRLSPQGSSSCTPGGTSWACTYNSRAKKSRQLISSRPGTSSSLASPYTHLSSLTIAIRISCSEPPLSFLGGILPCCLLLGKKGPKWLPGKNERVRGLKNKVVHLQVHHLQLKPHPASKPQPNA